MFDIRRENHLAGFTIRPLHVRINEPKKLH